LQYVGILQNVIVKTWLAGRFLAETVAVQECQPHRRPGRIYILSWLRQLHRNVLAEDGVTSSSIRRLTTRLNDARLKGRALFMHPLPADFAQRFKEELKLDTSKTQIPQQPKTTTTAVAMAAKNKRSLIQRLCGCLATNRSVAPSQVELVLAEAKEMQRFDWAATPFRCFHGLALELAMDHADKVFSPELIMYSLDTKWYHLAASLGLMSKSDMLLVANAIYKEFDDVINISA